MKPESIIITLLAIAILTLSVYHGITVQNYEKRINVLKEESLKILEEESAFQRAYDSLKLRIRALEDSASQLSRQAEKLKFAEKAPASLLVLRDSLVRFDIPFSIKDSLLCTCLEGGQRIFFAFDSLEVIKKKARIYENSFRLCQSEKALLASYVDTLQTKALDFERRWRSERKRRMDAEISIRALKRERNLAAVGALIFFGAFILK